MRGVVWVVLLFAAAAVAAGVLGSNDGLVSLYFAGWRTDLSLNFFLILMAAFIVVLLLAWRALEAVGGLPQRAREWRELQRERAASAALAEAQLEYFAARYARAARAAQRAAALHADAPKLRAEDPFSALAHLLAAASLHRLQDRSGRDEQWRAAVASSQKLPRGQDAAQLLAAEWAIDDRDAPRAMQTLAALPPGTARRTHALRLKLHAARLAAAPDAALHTARLLAKHQAFSPHAARSLLRSLCSELLEASPSSEALRQAWAQLEPAERADPLVAAQAARRAVALGQPEDARQWLRPQWDRLGELDSSQREAVALALAEAAAGAGSEWLGRADQAQGQWPRDAAVQAAVAALYAQRQLWGKAKAALEMTLAATELPLPTRRAAARQLAQLAREQGDEVRAARIEHEAAALG